MERKIAYFIDNASIADVDASMIEEGNPGIGGTEYLILLHVALLSKRDNNLSVKLWLTCNQSIPSCIDAVITEDVSSAILEAEHDGFEIFVLKHDAGNITRNLLVSQGQMHFVVWCHIFVCFWELDYYVNNSSVSKIVYVGREMYDLYRDHPSFDKATYIYNSVNLAGCADLVEQHPFQKRQHVVTYIGSLVPFKGFHKLAEAWPQVLERIPDAELYVIGSGCLYQASAELGKYGLAEKDYEAYFMKYLTSGNKIIPSVHFMGKMGIEKKDIMLQTKVGVPNPTGITETFCLSAVELQAYGALIATMKAPGYLDTVINGVLCTKPEYLTDTICNLLKKESSNYDETLHYFQKEFSQNNIIVQWEQLLSQDICSNSTKRLSNKFYRLKFLKEIMRRLNYLIPINRYFPPIERLLLFIERRILNKTTYMDSNLIIK